MSLHDQHTLDDMTPFVEEWKDLEGSNTMFTSSIKYHGSSKWEIQYFPWWLDYPLGSCPREDFIGLGLLCNILHPFLSESEK